MQLDVRKIIEIPGASLSFECEVSEERLDFPSVNRYRKPPTHTDVFLMKRVFSG
jgi:hypothetical protein